MYTQKQAWRREGNGFHRGARRDFLYHEMEATASSTPSRSTSEPSLPSKGAITTGVSRLWSTTGDLKKCHKKVKWNQAIRVILIPTREEYQHLQLGDNLWWKESDYSTFKLAAVEELTNMMKLLQIDSKAAMFNLYQPKHSANGDTSPRTSTGLCCESPRLKATSVDSLNSGDDSLVAMSSSVPGNTVLAVMDNSSSLAEAAANLAIPRAASPTIPPLLPATPHPHQRPPLHLNKPLLDSQIQVQVPYTPPMKPKGTVFTYRVQSPSPPRGGGGGPVETHLCVGMSSAKGRIEGSSSVIGNSRISSKGPAYSSGKSSGHSRQQGLGLQDAATDMELEDRSAFHVSSKYNSSEDHRSGGSFANQSLLDEFRHGGSGSGSKSGYDNAMMSSKPVGPLGYIAVVN